MRIARLFVVCWVAAAGSAAAQPVPPSTYDTNPKCSQRNVDPNDPECIIPQEGEPRHKFPPPKKTGQPPSPAPPPSTPPAQQKDFNSPASGAKSK